MENLEESPDKSNENDKKGWKVGEKADEQGLISLVKKRQWGNLIFSLKYSKGCYTKYDHHDSQFH